MHLPRVPVPPLPIVPADPPPSERRVALCVVGGAGTGTGGVVLMSVVDVHVIAARPQVEDWDRFSGNDFIGRVAIPAAALFAAGPGEHKYTLSLQPSKKHPLSVQ
jgi:hypothetical protein